MSGSAARAGPARARRVAADRVKILARFTVYLKANYGWFRSIFRFFGINKATCGCGLFDVRNGNRFNIASAGREPERFRRKGKNKGRSHPARAPDGSARGGRARAPASGAIRAVKVRLREKFTPR